MMRPELVLDPVKLLADPFVTFLLGVLAMAVLVLVVNLAMGGGGGRSQAKSTGSRRRSRR